MIAETLSVMLDAARLILIFIAFYCFVRYNAEDKEIEEKPYLDWTDDEIKDCISRSRVNNDDISKAEKDNEERNNDIT